MLKKQRRPSIINNEQGMAVFEMIPIIVVIVLFLNFSLGFFGAIHTGILNSIAARNYTFETFRHRANLTYFRNSDFNFKDIGMRFHGTTSEKVRGEKWIASTRLIDFMNFDTRATVFDSKSDHEKTRGLGDGRNQTVGANPIWIKTAYGICLDAKCGGS